MPFKRSELKSATSFHHLLQIAFSEINKLPEYQDLSYDDFLENYVNKEEQTFIVGEYKVETTPEVGLYPRTIKVFDENERMVKGFLEA